MLDEHLESLCNSSLIELVSHLLLVVMQDLDAHGPHFQHGALALVSIKDV